MHRLVNIPHEKDRGHEIVPTVDGATLILWNHRHDDQAGEYDCRIGDLYIGDHMFEPKNRDGLRMMVGRALRLAIEEGRAIGYRQAQTDIVRALGIQP